MTPNEFKQIRKDAGLSINQIAGIVGVDPRTIRRYEDGTRAIGKPIQILMRLVNEGILK